MLSELVQSQKDKHWLYPEEVSKKKGQRVEWSGPRAAESRTQEEGLFFQIESPRDPLLSTRPLVSNTEDVNVKEGWSYISAALHKV